MNRYALCLLAFIGILGFPWPYAALLVFALALYDPLMGVSFGLIADALYYSHAVSFFPLATIAGIAASIIAFFLRRFIQTRVSDFSYR